MKQQRVFFSLVVPVLVLLIAVVGLVHAQGVDPPQVRAPHEPLGTAFTYQGQLELDGEPVNEACQLAFRLYDDATTGSQVGAAITETIVISDGLFTQALDFGTEAFTGDARWLGIRVMCPGDAGFADLGRQALTATPYALYASAAGNADLLDGQPAGAFWSTSGNAGTDPATVFLGTTDAQPLVLGTNSVERARLDAAGNLGLGTNTPSERLTVRGNAHVLGEGNPAAQGFTSTNLDYPTAVYVSGHYAYVTSYLNDRLVVFDVSDPANVVALGFTSTNLSGPESVYISGRYAYVASWSNNRLAVFDVSDPTNIVALGFTSTNLDGPRSVYVSGRTAYVASWSNDRLAVFDVSDPANIVALGFTSTNLDYPTSVTVSGRYAYVTSSGNDRLAVFDVSDPSDIVALGFTSANLDVPRSVTVAGHTAYVASNWNDRLAVFDVSDPANIVALGFTSTNLNEPRSVYVSGHTAYVTSSGNDRLAVFDVSDPANIVALGFSSTNLDGPRSVYVSGHTAYVTSSGNDRLAVFELNHLEAPTLETGNLQSGYLDVIDNAIVGNNLHVQGGLNVGPGGALVGGDVAVEGDLQVVGNYIQFPTITGGGPPAADCDEASEAGRIVVRTDGTTNLYICTGTGGWVSR
jgi:hypothetical protein